MSVTLRTVILWILFVGLVSGCMPYPEPRNAVEEQDQREILNEGYSILYSNLSTLSKGKWVLLFKAQSDSLKHVVNDVSEYAGTLKNTLKRISQDYPAVDIDLEPLPVMEQRTRSALMKSRVLTFAPLIGLRGMDFERRMLQSLEGPLNHLHFLCDALANEEPEPSLKRVLKDAASRLNQLRMKVANLLDKQYYRDKKPDNKK